MLRTFSEAYRAFVMAMERLEERLHRVTAALDAASIRYAVVGGNAVALWVAKSNPGATRTTKDVDLMVNRSDLAEITSVMSSLGFPREDLRSLVLFLDPAEMERKSGVHLVWAGEKVRPSNLVPTPTLDEAVRDDEHGFWVIGLPALVRMKLTSFRPIDRVHIGDLLGVGMIDDSVRSALPPVLLERLAEIEGEFDPLSG